MREIGNVQGYRPDGRRYQPSSLSRWANLRRVVALAGDGIQSLGGRFDRSVVIAAPRLC
jgi:hypothetical protein